MAPNEILIWLRNDIRVAFVRWKSSHPYIQFHSTTLMYLQCQICSIWCNSGFVYGPCAFERHRMGWRKREWEKNSIYFMCIDFEGTKTISTKHPAKSKQNALNYCVFVSMPFVSRNWECVWMWMCVCVCFFFCFFVGSIWQTKCI